MRLAFLFDRVESVGDIKTKIARKIAQLDKYLKHVSSDLRAGVVKLSKGERWGYRVKVDLKIPGKDVIAESQKTDLLSAVDDVVDKLKTGLIKKSEKLKWNWKR
ncbi:MAG: ribosome-associated translation inhibitor RaiA [bacterium]|nr:ribosome-associated translation inhibitor RaiA [Candidatus Microgenomates bacterium CPR3]MCQ3944489.1 ribosome-associated translation inhibitor RaiA [bacterium]RIK51184.1 MAG: ribosome-associated translation inhibitor RaiA [Candidatus Microgenomates bacterium]